MPLTRPLKSTLQSLHKIGAGLGGSGAEAAWLGDADTRAAVIMYVEDAEAGPTASKKILALQSPASARTLVGVTSTPGPYNTHIRVNCKHTDSHCNAKCGRE